MPIREGYCVNEKCYAKVPQEHFYHASADPVSHPEAPLNPCNVCGGPTKLRQISRTHVVFTGVITARYNDRDKEGATQEGHMAWRRKSSRSGKPEPVFIETFEQQRAFCREEGLANPTEVGRNYQVAGDGKTVENGMGLPGCEV